MSSAVSAKPKARDIVFRSVVMLRESPFRLFATKVLTNARCFDILTLRSLSLTVIRSCKTSLRSVRRFLVFLGATHRIRTDDLLITNQLYLHPADQVAFMGCHAG